MRILLSSEGYIIHTIKKLWGWGSWKVDEMEFVHENEVVPPPTIAAHQWTYNCVMENKKRLLLCVCVCVWIWVTHCKPHFLLFFFIIIFKLTIIMKTKKHVTIGTWLYNDCFALTCLHRTQNITLLVWLSTEFKKNKERIF